MILQVLLDVPGGTAPSTGAGVITAVATVLTAMGGLILAVGVLIPILRTARATSIQVEQVHTIVNQQRTDAQRYNIALAELLKKHGIEVPIDQSLPVTGTKDADNTVTQQATDRALANERDPQVP